MKTDLALNEVRFRKTNRLLPAVVETAGSNF